RSRHRRSPRDWSSDVCSSELQWPVTGRRHRAPARCPAAAAAVDVLRRMAGAARRLVLVNDLERSGVGLLLAIAGTQLLTRSPVEIGRASCRESVKRSVVEGCE